MRAFGRLRVVAVAALIALVGSSCYYLDALQTQQNSEPVPWFCDPTAFNSVTTVGMGSVNFYEGVTRGPLGYEDCKTLGLQLDAVQAFANQYPTRADAEAAGYHETFYRIPGMGTHHGLGALTPEMLADPAFDPHNPQEFLDSGLPGHIDHVFEIARPEFLQYDGAEPDAPLVGMSYYVYTDTGLPPEGFAGDNDWWHHHPTLCFDPATAVASLGVNTTDPVCESRGGINVHFADFYMLHAWVVPDVELHSDIYAPLHPCIQPGGTIFDMGDACHDEPPVPGGPAPAAAGAESGDAAIPAGFFCPIALIEEQWQEANA